MEYKYSKIYLKIIDNHTPLPRGTSNRCVRRDWRSKEKEAI